MGFFNFIGDFANTVGRVINNAPQEVTREVLEIIDPAIKQEKINLMQARKDAKRLGVRYSSSDTSKMIWAKIDKARERDIIAQGEATAKEARRRKEELMVMQARQNARVFGIKVSNSDSASDITRRIALYHRKKSKEQQNRQDAVDRLETQERSRVKRESEKRIREERQKQIKLERERARAKREVIKERTLRNRETDRRRKEADRRLREIEREKRSAERKKRETERRTREAVRRERESQRKERERQRRASEKLRKQAEKARKKSEKKRKDAEKDRRREERSRRLAEAKRERQNRRRR